MGGVGYVLVMTHRVAHGVSHFQSSFRTNVSKVTICAQILKWRRFLTVIHRFLMVIHRFLTVILTRGRYRAARAAKNPLKLTAYMLNFDHYCSFEIKLAPQQWTDINV